MNAVFRANRVSENRNNDLMPSHAIPDNVIQTDVLIIGAGLAGLSTALALPKSLNVTILSKAALETCSSHYAQGGIAASLDVEDSIADHIADTLIAGAGLCATDNTTSILGKGQQAVQWLYEHGVPFTLMPQQNPTLESLARLQTTDLHLTQEGGHGRRRVAHADDATGRHVMETLTAKTLAAANLTVLPFHEALTLLTVNPTDSAAIGSTDKRCQGAIVFDHGNQRQLTFHSGAVVLASGGLGQLFKRASAPNVCVGDGVMMAWQAGCRLANLEFIQFHPTGLALKDSSFLISEALRGEGGRLYCPQTGTRFMLEADARAELAPRDIVARAISEQINSTGLGYVHLDVSHLPAEFLRAHFPQIHETLLTLGIDMTTSPIPVAPTAHYSCGGVVACAKGLTDLPGLYAAGEVAYTGLHGANRLASNSLLECVVVGRNIAAHLPRYLQAVSQMSASLYPDQSSKLPTGVWTPPILTDTQLVTLPTSDCMTADSHTNDSGMHFMPSNRRNIDKINNVDNINNIADITANLKALMSTHMGITRHAETLEQALIQIKTWQDAISTTNLNTSYCLDGLDRLDSSATPNGLARFQLMRQLQLAILIIQSAYQRYESRGGHYRKDYPHLATDAKVSVIRPLQDKVGDSVWALQPITSNTEDHRSQTTVEV